MTTKQFKINKLCNFPSYFEKAERSECLSMLCSSGPEGPPSTLVLFKVSSREGISTELQFSLSLLCEIASRLFMMPVHPLAAFFLVEFATVLISFWTGLEFCCLFSSGLLSVSGNLSFLLLVAWVDNFWGSNSHRESVFPDIPNETSPHK